MQKQRLKHHRAMSVARRWRSVCMAMCLCLCSLNAFAVYNNKAVAGDGLEILLPLSA